MPCKINLPASRNWEPVHLCSKKPLDYFFNFYFKTETNHLHDIEHIKSPTDTDLKPELVRHTVSEPSHYGHHRYQDVLSFFSSCKGPWLIFVSDPKPSLFMEQYKQPLISSYSFIHYFRLNCCSCTCHAYGYRLLKI